MLDPLYLTLDALVYAVAQCKVAAFQRDRPTRGPGERRGGRM